MSESYYGNMIEFYLGALERKEKLEAIMKKYQEEGE